MIRLSRLNRDIFHLKLSLIVARLLSHTHFYVIMLILIIMSNPNVVGHLDAMVIDNLSIRC